MPAVLNHKCINALFYGIKMCSVQIGCEVNKHYFSTELSYKMTGNLSMGTGVDALTKKPTARKKKTAQS